MTTHFVPLVGMHFRPPAKAILAVLPARTKLRLVPEPDNPHDPNALRVEVATSDIPNSDAAREQLNSDALPFGFTVEDILGEASWHLGYVKATEALWLAPLVVQALALSDPPDPSREFLPASLVFDASGKPAVRVEFSSGLAATPGVRQ